MRRENENSETEKETGEKRKNRRRLQSSVEKKAAISRKNTLCAFFVVSHNYTSLTLSLIQNQTRPQSLQPQRAEKSSSRSEEST